MTAKTAIQSAAQSQAPGEHQGIMAFLESGTKQVARALPFTGPDDERHAAADRLVRSAITLFRTTPTIQQCTPQSIMGGLLTCAELGLEIGPLRQAYLVPFGKEAQFIIGYKGYIDLARRSGSIARISARVVREKDDFNVEFGSIEQLTHKPNLFDSDPGELVVAYCLARLSSGEDAIHVMRRDEVLKRKNASRGSGSPSSPWNQWEEEMWRKTAVRGAAPFLPLTVEAGTALDRDNTTRTWLPDTEPSEPTYADPEPEAPAIEATATQDGPAGDREKLESYTAVQLRELIAEPSGLGKPMVDRMNKADLVDKAVELGL